MQERKTPTRGFVTMATGKAKYYRLAETLLLSYRLTTDAPMPFAIICDQKNRYTEAFDDVVLLENPSYSYVDKLELLRKAPYDETIFVDSDCIAFADLNEYWNRFQGATDLSCFGEVHPLSYKGGWYTTEGSGKYADQLRYVLDFHSGILFVRRGAVCDEVYRLSKEIIENYYDYKFRTFADPADEPALALAMGLCGCKPVPYDRRVYAFYTLIDTVRVVEADFFKKRCAVDYDRRENGILRVDSVMLLHYGTQYTIRPIYSVEALKVHFLHRHGRPWNAAEAAVFTFWGRAVYRAKQGRRDLKRQLRRLRRKLLNR